MKKISKYILIIFLLINIEICYCQNYIKYIPAYYDISITNKIIDSLKAQKVDTFLIYLTTIHKNQINESYNKEDSIEATNIIWQQNGQAYSQLITDSFIYKPLIISNNIFFKYPYLKNIWLTKEENTYKFLCPINSPLNKDIVIYITPKFKRFFEMGENTYYKLNPSKNKSRIEFISLLKQSLSSTMFKWKKQSNYDRWIDFPEQTN